MIIKLLIIGIVLVGGVILVVPIDASLPEPSSFTDNFQQKITFIKEGIIDTGNSIYEYLQGIALKF